ncbi:class I SAM-dependent methyltransferase [Planctomicrobium sp. SH661]|uniref:class I SAM-dependent methyltransferase n=1 Tax=Planctomicrobium sp. SH661 TaxID=3448124 RepID=UPI003F5CB40A
MQKTQASIYDYPKYYDLLFGSDWKAEYDFLLACFDRYAKCDVQRVFEPACGTGRLLIKLAQAGYEVAGNDLNPKAVAYCNKRLKRAGFDETITVGDMSNYKLKKKVHAAFNMINSFRHLDSEQAAESHLQCVANSLMKGGLYLLGLHLTPTVGDRIESEEWTARRGHLQVNSVMWSQELDLKGRNEKLGMTIDVYTPTESFQIVDEMNYRTYTAVQMEQLLSTCPQFEIAGLHDFCYEIDTRTEITPITEDVVFVLRKR